MPIAPARPPAIEPEDRAAKVETVMDRLTRGREIGELMGSQAGADFVYLVRDALSDMKDIDAFTVDFPEDDRVVFTLATRSKKALRHRVVVMGDTVSWHARESDSKRRRLMVEGPATAKQVVWLLDVVSDRRFEL